MKYVADDSTTFWAIGPDSGVIAKHAFGGTEVEMVIPFEGAQSGEVNIIKSHDTSYLFPIFIIFVSHDFFFFLLFTSAFLLTKLVSHVPTT